MKKKLLALTLAAAMCLSLVPTPAVTAFAADPAATGQPTAAPTA